MRDNYFLTDFDTIVSYYGIISFSACFFNY